MNTHLYLVLGAP